MRWAETHDWPAWLNPAVAMVRAACSQSPSASMMTGELLPSSRPTFLRRRLGCDAPADLGGAGEGDVGDVGVLDQGVAHLAAGAGDDVQVAGRQAALVDQQARPGRRPTAASGWPA